MGDVERFLGTSRFMHEAVLTIPTGLGMYQRDAVIQAAELAGWNVLRLIAKPEAAASAFQYQFPYSRCGAMDWLFTAKDYNSLLEAYTWGWTESHQMNNQFTVIYSLGLVAYRKF